MKLAEIYNRYIKGNSNYYEYEQIYKELSNEVTITNLINGTPVSYTHLDVYKRQVIRK